MLTTTNKIPGIITTVFFSTLFLSITIFLSLWFAIVFILFIFILAMINRVDIIKINLRNEDIHVCFLFYLFFFISFVVISFSNIFISGINFLEYYPQKFGRMTNVMVYFILFLYIIHGKNCGNITTKRIFNAYVTGCCVLLFFGVWQIFNLIFHVPYPTVFVTRDRIHTIDETMLLPFMTRRITSIAEEPAYLIPYLMDAIIILFYTTKKYILMALFVIVLIFTLSLAGYANFFLIIMIMLFFAKNTLKIIFVKLVALFCIVFGIYLLQDIFFSVLRRLNPSELVASGRLQNSILSINYMLHEASPFNFIFGFGPRGMGYIRNFVFHTSGWLQGEMIGVTTHIIFVDFFIDHGIMGLIIIILLFYYLFMLTKKSYNRTGNRMGQVLCLNLIITSLYTADYASPRFTAVIILLLCIYKDSRNEERVIMRAK